VNGRFSERLIFVIGVSIKTGAVFSCFEGIYYYLTFPLSNFPGLVELFARNLMVFLAAGLVVLFPLSLVSRLFKGITAHVLPCVLSALILFPVYFYLITLLEGTGFIYRYLSDTRVVIMVIALPVVLLLIALSKFLATFTARRYWGLLAALFFLITVGHTYVEWISIVKGEMTGYLSLMVILVLALVLYFIASRIQRMLSGADDQGFRRARLRSSLMIVLYLAIVSVLFYVFQGSGSVKSFRSLDRPSVILIVLDTARADRFSCYGYGRDTTPFLKTLCKDATMYSGVIAPAPWTLPSHASIFTGLYPSAHGATWKTRYLDDRFFTLPEYLSERGYNTIGFCNNPAVTRVNGLAQGFDSFIEVWEDEIMNPTFSHRLEWFLRRFLKLDDGGAFRTNQWIMEWLGRIYSGDRPFFLFVNLMESHLWFDAPESYHEMFLKEELSRTVKHLQSNSLYPILTGLLSLTDKEWQEYGDVYDGDLFYLDKRLEELYRLLEKHSFLDNTIVIITSDHGEHLGEHRMIDHMLSLYEPLLQVPLIVKVPGNMPGLPVIEGQVQLLDIFPTLVDLLGFKDDTGEMYFQGLSLAGVERLHRDLAIAEYQPPKERIFNFLEDYPEGTAILKYDRILRSISVGSLKYIWSSNGDSELYDLSADPDEMKNLMENRRQEADLLEGKLMDWLASFKHAEETEGEIEIDAETRRRLKALGYID
jgi:arylsulfatase A-like enzyme